MNQIDINTRISVPTDYTNTVNIIFNILYIIIVIFFLLKLKNYKGKKTLNTYIGLTFALLAIHVMTRFVLLLTSSSVNVIAPSITPSDFEPLTILVTLLTSGFITSNKKRLVISLIPTIITQILFISSALYIQELLLILFKSEIILLPIFYYYKSTST